MPLRALVSSLLIQALFSLGAFLVSRQLIPQAVWDEFAKWLTAHSGPGVDLFCGFIMAGAAWAYSKAQHEAAALYNEAKKANPFYIPSTPATQSTVIPTPKV